MTELKLRIGSRKSELALKQTYIIEDLLKKAYPGLETEIVTSDTLGDKNLIQLQCTGLLLSRQAYPWHCVQPGRSLRLKGHLPALIQIHLFLQMPVRG